MADAKREHDFDIAISLTVYVKNAFNGRFSPRGLNPYAEYVEMEDLRTEEERKIDTKAGIQELKMGLAAMMGLRNN